MIWEQKDWKQTSQERISRKIQKLEIIPERNPKWR